MGHNINSYINNIEQIYCKRYSKSDHLSHLNFLGLQISIDGFPGYGNETISDWWMSPDKVDKHDKYTSMYLVSRLIYSNRYMVTVIMQYSYVTYLSDMSTAYLNILLNHVINLDQPLCNGLVRNNTNNIHLLKIIYFHGNNAIMWP